MSMESFFCCSDFTLYWDLHSTSTQPIGAPPHTSLYVFDIEVWYAPLLYTPQGPSTPQGHSQWKSRCRWAYSLAVGEVWWLRTTGLATGARRAAGCLTPIMAPLFTLLTLLTNNITYGCCTTLHTASAQATENTKGQKCWVFYKTGTENTTKKSETHKIQKIPNSENTMYRKEKKK